MVTTTYDNLDRPTLITYPDTTTKQFQYTQDFGQGLVPILDLTTSIDRRGLSTTRHYDSNRHMDWIADPLGHRTRFGWCGCGELASITDPLNHTTTFNRDIQGRVYQKLFADGTAINYLYDGQTAAQGAGATSRLQSSTDAKNQRTNYTYFLDDDIQQITYTDTNGQPLVPPTPSVSFTYDSNYNRVLTMTDGSGPTVYGYYPITDPVIPGSGRLASINGPLANDTIVFGYDSVGRINTRSINGGNNSETWVFDSLGRVTTDTNKLGMFTYGYVGVTNRLDTLTYPPNNQTAHYSYFDNLGDKRLQQILNRTSTSALISQFDYTYDHEGQVLTWKKNYPGLSPAPQRYDLTYDNADQLKRAPLKNDATNALITNYLYDYDWANNRTSETVGTTNTTSTPNLVNEITSQSGGTNRNLTYDFNGSLVNDGLTRTFEWDGANRLVAINSGTTNRSEFTYDGLSRCAKIVEKTNGSVTSTRKFVWCGNDMCEFRDTNDAVTLFVYPQGQYSGTKYFYTRDHLGSIREMFKTNDAVVARYDYDSWGRSTTVLNTVSTDFNFTGLYRHSASGLIMAVHRFYDPDLGRWLSRDPIGELGNLDLGVHNRRSWISPGSLDNLAQNDPMGFGAADVNLYRYVHNNPLNGIDPMGEGDGLLHWIDSVLDAIAGGIAGAGKIFPTGYAVKKEREAYDEYAECSANPPADDPNCYKAYDKVEKRKKMCEHVSQAGERH
jgi:RHS repeat-associated protein